MPNSEAVLAGISVRSLRKLIIFMNRKCIVRIEVSKQTFHLILIKCVTVVKVELLCKARSMLGKVGRFILVGDYVHVINIDWQDARGLVSGIDKRSSEITNPKIANVDHFALVFSMADPLFEPFQVCRAEGSDFIHSRCISYVHPEIIHFY